MWICILVFGYKSGVESLTSKVKDVESKSEGDLPSSFDSEPSKVEEYTEDKLPKIVDEYGYGFWLRFLTVYPKRLM